MIFNVWQDPEYLGRIIVHLDIEGAVGAVEVIAAHNHQSIHFLVLCGHWSTVQQLLLRIISQPMNPLGHLQQLIALHAQDLVLY